MTSPGTRTLALAVLCALAACSSKSASGTPPAEAGTRSDAPRAQPDGSASTVDAAPAGSPDGGVVSCYTEANASQSCTLPAHCCFSNFSSQHDGSCSSAACAWGTITCDGPEDCATGAHCCSHALFASDGSLAGYSIACQWDACGAAPASYELCHPSGPACSNGGTCVTALGNDNDLPRTLDICK